MGADITGVADRQGVEIRMRPSSSTTSKAGRFLALQTHGVDGINYNGLSVAVNSRTALMASSKFPLTCRMCAPWTMAWAIFPLATLPAGIKTIQGNPARPA